MGLAEHQMRALGGDVFVSEGLVQVQRSSACDRVVGRGILIAISARPD